jgi:hypothetical protein
LDQNSLYELVSEYGEVYGNALPRDSYLLKTVDHANNWLQLSDVIGDQRADQLYNGHDLPSASEMRLLLEWQVEQALEISDPSVTPIIWLCKIDDTGDFFAVESWDDSFYVELKFRLVGKYRLRAQAVDDLNKGYIFNIADV